MYIRGIWTAGAALLAFVGLGVSDAHAAAAYCESKIGSCDVSNDGGDSFGCECSGGGGGGGGGGNEWGGLSEAELEVVCNETLELFCGEGPPPTGVFCETEIGSCNVDNEPDSVGCACENGSGGFGGGGNEWDGLSDEELYDVCLQQIQQMCDPAPVEWDCENEYGGCDIEVDPEPFYGCGCAEGGDGGGGPGDPGWSELSEDELHVVCLEQIAEVCGGPGPTTGETDSATTSQEESGSEGPATSGTEDAGTEDAGTEDTGGETGTFETTGDPDDGGASASATAGATAGASATAGDDESTGDGDGGANDGEASGCSCDVDDRDPQGMIALALLGLVGLRTRRRRA